MHWLVPAVAIAGLASLGAFAAMRVDKRRAERKARRIRERSLASWALLGGWPGLVAGGIAFRHKTSARGFQAKAGVGAIVHAGIVAGFWWMGI